jgi:hypothetical protein
MQNYQRDYLTKPGAHDLAARIKAYWRLQGKHPNVWVSPIYLSQSPSAAEKPYYVVRSDMVNGAPSA